VGPFSVTASGLILTAVAAWFVWSGQYLIGLGIFILGSILDAVDGELARRNGVVSRAGAILDSSFDRIGELLMFGGMLAGQPGNLHGELVYLVPAVIGGSFMVSYVRARAEGVGIPCTVGLFSRTERLILLMVGLLLAGLWNTRALVWILAVLAAGTWFTAAQRLVRVLRDGRGVPLKED